MIGANRSVCGFMSNNSPLLILPLVVVLAVAGWQDWRKREVSNWLTIPFLVIGIVGFVVRADWAGALFVFPITVAALRGWMGGADWKILVGLFGLYPPAGYVSLVLAALWGAGEIVAARSRASKIPGVTAYAVATALTFAIHLWYLIALN